MDKSGQRRTCLPPCPLLPTFKNSHYKMIHNLYVFRHFCKSEISPVLFREIWLTTLIWVILMWCRAVFQTSGWGHRELFSSRFSESTWFSIMLILPHGPVKLVLPSALSGFSPGYSSRNSDGFCSLLQSAAPRDSAVTQDLCYLNPLGGLMLK